MTDPGSPARGWATASVWSGAAWIVLAMLPVPVTTLLGLPLAAYALLGGWAAAREGRTQADGVAVRRARWGMRLGCAGFVYLAGFYVLAGGVLAAGAVAAIWAAIQGLQ